MNNEKVYTPSCPDSCFQPNAKENWPALQKPSPMPPPLPNMVSPNMAGSNMAGTNAPLSGTVVPGTLEMSWPQAMGTPSDGDLFAQGSVDGPPALTDSEYIAGFLRQYIGRLLLVEFVVGTNSFMDRSGFLREVGVNYIVLEDLISRNLVMCDLYSIRFVTIR